MWNFKLEVWMPTYLNHPMSSLIFKYISLLYRYNFIPILWLKKTISWVKLDWNITHNPRVCIRKQFGSEISKLTEVAVFPNIHAAFQFKWLVSTQVPKKSSKTPILKSTLRFMGEIVSWHIKWQLKVRDVCVCFLECYIVLSRGSG